jgi:Immunity protein family (Imm11)
MLYYRILADDRRFPDRWFLDEPVANGGNEIDAREFAYGRSYTGPLPVNVPVQCDGRKVQFNLAAFDMPVVSEEIAHLVAKIACAEVECFPVTIGGAIPGYAILNAVCREACVDESRSEILRWNPEDGRPDKVGRYRMVSNLTIDPARAQNRHLFRVEDWEVALIVSDKVKEALEDIPNLGVVFAPVC